MFSGILSWLFKCMPTAIVGYTIMLIRWKEIVKISPSYHIHVSSVSARYFYCICGMWPARVIFISLLWHIVFARVNKWSKELQKKKKNKQEKTAISFCVKTFVISYLSIIPFLSFLAAADCGSGRDSRFVLQVSSLS